MADEQQEHQQEQSPQDARIEALEKKIESLVATLRHYGIHHIEQEPQAEQAAAPTEPQGEQAAAQ